MKPMAKGGGWEEWRKLQEDGGNMEESGIMDDLYSLTDKMLSQKIQIFIDKVMPIKYYYIDEKSNSLVVGIDENYPYVAEKFYNEATSSMEFFDADSIDMQYVPRTKDTQYIIKIKKPVKFASEINCLTQKNLIKIAKFAHEVNKAYCEAIGDNSQPTWEDAPEWQKKSTINGVKFHLENPDAAPDSSHDNWLKQKQEEGWKYGAVKNPETKEHPNFLPYEQLPVEQKAKDYLFKQVIESFRNL